ncbi:aminomethyl-transferring glycine dehydrogenase subunit GcvPB [bacterium]|nr:aminomethyl-transferring glycine dehydrogenase subunit GcvPB [bacterium]
MSEPLLFEMGSPGRRGFSLPVCDVPDKPLEKMVPPATLRTAPANLPELSELDVIRHYIHLSVQNHHVDKGFYPLGSCTMKYNPKINEAMARIPGFAQLHPMQKSGTVQGALKLMAELSCYLGRIAGLDAVTLQPAAGAHGEMTGIKLMRAFHESKGNPRKTIILPDSAHGTNPASATISGYETIQIRSSENGLVDLDDLKKNMNTDVAGFMLTNPNTLGLFESQVLQIADIVHEAGALLYMDGANLNALLGIVRPGDTGFDIVHFNLHKTFSSPHGGGGPGSGPVGVKDFLKPFLPSPILDVCDSDRFDFQWQPGQSIGKLQTFWGNFGIMIRAYVYIRMLGASGLKEVSRNAILNANYLMRKLQGRFLLPHTQHHMHEFVLSGDLQKESGVKTLDMAKRLLDFGIHAPTVYFPLIVHEAMMIEPTETESQESLDHFADIMLQIADEAEKNPGLLKEAPCSTPVSRLDEVQAARVLDVNYYNK